MNIGVTCILYTLVHRPLHLLRRCPWLNFPFMRMAIQPDGVVSCVLPECQQSSDFFFQMNNLGLVGQTGWLIQLSFSNRRTQKRSERLLNFVVITARCLFWRYYIHNFTMMGTQVYENTFSCSVIDLGIFSLANSTAYNFLHVNINHLFHSQKYLRVRIIKVLSGEPVQAN